MHSWQDIDEWPTSPEGEDWAFIIAVASRPVVAVARGRMTPNRLNFEDKIWRVNNSLSRRHDELKHYWSEARREELKQLKTIVINDLQAQHLAKQREIQELEDTDLIYKDLAQAQQKLCLVEEKYKRSTFSNIREEQVQVNEVNRIKRNIAKLAKYIPLVEQRKSLEAQIKADRHKNRTIRLQMRAAQDKIRDSRHKIKAIQTPFLRLREVLADLKVEKRNLIEKYNDERQNYSAWLKHNKVNKTSSTFPSAILQDQSGDSLEPVSCPKVKLQTPYSLPPKSSVLFSVQSSEHRWSSRALQPPSKSLQ
uniref:Uncharacterized protein n=1 Tax=Ditylenchus dipsaci TaxID=166011 RepID=A0A915CUW1_9BILA